MAKSTKEELLEVDDIEVVQNEDKSINVNVELKRDKRHVQTRKYVGELLEGDALPTIFVSKRKELMIFITDSEYVKFKANTFSTNVPRILKALRENPLLGNEMFEGGFPDYVKRELDEDKKYQTKFAEDIEPNYGK